jgi:RNA polymerase sigma-70 factor (ECF subfamily)
VGDQNNAEELTSQTFLAVLERLPQYRHKGKFSSWLFRIARNKAMDFFRQQSRIISDSVDGDFIAVMDDPHFIDDVIEVERAEALVSLIKQMPADQKELLRLRFVVGLTYKEIAEVSGRRTSAVKKSIYRLLDVMKCSLEKADE